MLSFTTLKKRLAIFLSPAGMSLFPDRESLVSDIPAGDVKIDNFFFSVVGDPPVVRVICDFTAGIEPLLLQLPSAEHICNRIRRMDSRGTVDQPSQVLLAEPIAM